MATFTGRKELRIGGVKMLHAERQPRIRSSVQQIVRAERLGRNDPCACGSGKKFKKCCGVVDAR